MTAKCMQNQIILDPMKSPGSNELRTFKISVPTRGTLEALCMSRLKVGKDEVWTPDSAKTLGVGWDMSKKNSIIFWAKKNDLKET